MMKEKLLLDTSSAKRCIIIRINIVEEIWTNFDIINFNIYKNLIFQFNEIYASIDYGSTSLSLNYIRKLNNETLIKNNDSNLINKNSNFKF